MYSHTLALLLIAALLLTTTPTGVEGQVLVSENLGRNAYTASGFWREITPPEGAFDGETRKRPPYWNSGAHPPQWIEVDLQGSYPITRVKLIVEQLPRTPCRTTHQVWVSPRSMGEDLSGATLLFTFSGSTRDGDWLDHELTSPVSGRHVQIRTTRSPSWVAWREVQVFAAVPF